MEEPCDPEMKREIAVHAVNTTETLDGTKCLFSNERKLKVSLAWVLRLKAMLLERVKGNRAASVTEGQSIQPLSGEELFQAELETKNKHQELQIKLLHCQWARL